MNEIRDYVRLTSTNPKLDFSFLYPGDWPLRESQGTNYAEVAILGPRNRENTYSLGLLIRVITASKKGERFVSLGEYVADFLAKSKRLTAFREISRTQSYLAGVKATEVETSYVIPLPINTVNPKDTLIVERRLFLKKDNCFYEVVFRAVEEDYYRYLEAFQNAIRTFEFRHDAVQAVYRPLVAPVPAYAVREPSVEYQADEPER